MYGLINQALRDMVLTHLGGVQLWSDICQEANVANDDFEMLTIYGDEVTGALVSATARRLNTTPDEILRRFGNHWISYTAEEGYGEIMSLFGADFISCLKNLNRMHGHMGAMMPALKPPRFAVVDRSSHGVTLHYYSTREGLGPMVVGILEGLARKYDTAITVDFVRKGMRSDHDEFDISFERA